MPSDTSIETIKRCLKEFQKSERRIPTIQELSAATAIGPGQLRSKIRRIIDAAQNSKSDDINIDDLRMVLKTVPKSANATVMKEPEFDALELDEGTERRVGISSAPIAQAHTDKLKEVRVNLQVKPADYQRKIESARTFLSNGDRVRISTLLTQTEVLDSEGVLAVYDQILDDLGQVALLEEGPQISGRTISMILSPA